MWIIYNLKGNVMFILHDYYPEVTQFKSKILPDMTYGKLFWSDFVLLNLSHRLSLKSIVPEGILYKYILPIINLF
jgi:hypothetical protein